MTHFQFSDCYHYSEQIPPYSTLHSMIDDRPHGSLGLGFPLEAAMSLEYDALELRVEEFRKLEDLYHYLKFAYGNPRRLYRLIPTTPPYLEQEVYDLESDRFLGLWLDGTFDFAGADDETVDRLDALFRRYLPLQRQRADP